MPDTDLECRRCCKWVSPKLIWKTAEDTDPPYSHLGAYCPVCGRWIKWVPQTEEWLQKAMKEA